MAKKKKKKEIGGYCKSTFSQVVKWNSDLKSVGKDSCVCFFPPTSLWVKERGEVGHYQLGWRGPSFCADRREGTCRQRENAGGDRGWWQNKGAELVGWVGGIRSPGERPAVETITKEERQGERRKTWRWGKKLRIKCWTALGFPVKWDVRSAAEAEVGNWSKNDLCQALSMIHARLSTEEDDTFSKLAFGNPQMVREIWGR